MFSLVRDRAGFGSSLEAEAVQTSVLHPGERSCVRPAIALEGDLDRVTGCPPDTDLATQRAVVCGGVNDALPTRMFRFRDALWVGGTAYAGRTVLRIDNRGNGHRLVPPTVRERLASGVIACTPFGSEFFGDWLVNDVLLHRLAQQIGPAYENDRRLYGDEPTYRELLDVPRTAVSAARFAELIYIDDRGANRAKRRRAQATRELLFERATPRHRGHRVFIARGERTTQVRGGRVRSLVNADAVRARLTDRGFLIVHPERLSTRELVEELLGARVVIGVEGSHLSHGFWELDAGGAIVALEPPYQFNNPFKVFVDTMGLDQRYAYLVGEEVPGGFSVDVDRMDRLLDQVETAIA